MEVQMSSRAARAWSVANGRMPGLAVVGVVGTRVLLGLIFVFREGLDKVQNWTTPRALVRFVSPGIANPHVPGFYRAFLTSVVVPHADVFRIVVMGSELLLGICLIVGLGVRLGAALQSFALLNYITVKTFPSPNANSDITMLVLFFGLFMVSAGRWYGLDGLLRARFRWLSWL
jgi:uncharacterized membrane protein YphA (DoxX/SURF4 family)